MERVYGVNGLRDRRHTSISCIRVASCLLLVTVFLSTFASYIVTAEDVPTLVTNDKYAAGDAVIFTGEGYIVGDSYKINVSLVALDGEPVEPVLVGEEIFFVADESGKIPADPPVSWLVPFDAENGTYEANAYHLIDSIPESPSVASHRFEVKSGLGDRLGAVAGDLEDLEETIVSEVVEEARERLLASLSNCIRKVQAAVSLLDEGKNNTARNQLRAARNMLTAFLHKLWAATASKTIDLVTAQGLNQTAFSYIEYIDSLIPTLIPVGKQLAINVRTTLQKQEAHLIKFMLKKSLSDDPPGVTSSSEEVILETFEEAKGKKEKLTDLYNKGEIDYGELVAESTDSDLETMTAKEIAEILEGYFNNEGDETQGRKFGQYIQLAKQILKENRQSESQTAPGDETTSGASSHQVNPHSNGAGGNGKKDDNGKRNNGPKVDKGPHGNPH